MLATPAQPRRESKLLSTWNLVGDCVTCCHMLVTVHLRDGDALGNGGRPERVRVRSLHTSISIHLLSPVKTAQCLWYAWTGVVANVPLTMSRYTLLWPEDPPFSPSTRAGNGTSLKVSISTTMVQDSPVSPDFPHISHTDHSFQDSPKQQQTHICLGAVSLPLCVGRRVHLPRHG